MNEPATLSSAPQPRDGVLPQTRLETYQERFYEFVRQHPEGLNRQLFAAVEPTPAFDEGLGGLEAPAPVQSWPVFLDSAQMSTCAELSLRLFNVVRSLPHRWFQLDTGKMCDFYGLDPAVAADLLQVLELPWGKTVDMMRGDFLWSETGLKLIEVNAYANLGGLHFAKIGKCYPQIPFLQRFFMEQDVVVRWRDPWKIFLAHAIEQAVARGLHAGGKLNLAIVIREPELITERDYLAAPYHSLLRQRVPQVAGNLLICNREQLVRDGATLKVFDQPVHILHEFYITCPSLPMSVEVRAWLDGIVDLYPGPMGYIHSDKRNLALLWQGTERGLFSPAETALIRQHVPWTWLLEPGVVTYQGERWELERLLQERQDNFVLKPAQGFGGAAIYLGRFSSPEEWRELVQMTLEYGTYCVQEYVPPALQIYQQGEQGSALGMVNWGFFVFHDHFGGNYLRLSPKEGHRGLISVASGGERGCCLELVAPGTKAESLPLVDEWSFLRARPSTLQAKGPSETAGS